MKNARGEFAPLQMGVEIGGRDVAFKAEITELDKDYQDRIIVEGYRISGVCFDDDGPAITLEQGKLIIAALEGEEYSDTITLALEEKYGPFEAADGR